MKVPITYVSVGDVQSVLNLTEEEASLITEQDLADIASDMEKDYVRQLFWQHLKILAVRHLAHLLPEEEDDEDDYTPDIY
jgi:hypothetical protein